jgi:hypothetical protein
MNKLLAVVVALAAGVLGAQPLDVRLSQGPPDVAYQLVRTYNVGNTIAAVCYSPSIGTSLRSQRAIAISAATTANPAVFTSTGHGFTLSTRPMITISGATGNWTPVNGGFVATIINANTFSIAIDSTAFGALTDTLTFTTTAPRQTIAEWSVLRYFYDANGNEISRSWLGGTSRDYLYKCTDAASSTNNIQ